MASPVVMARSKTIPPAVAMASAITALAVADASFGARVNDAVLRVLRAKASRGLITCA